MHFFPVEDPKLKEFLALMQPRMNQAVWANDDEAMANEALNSSAPISEQKQFVSAALEDEEEGTDEDDLYEEIKRTTSISDREGNGSSDEDSDINAKTERDHVIDAPEVSNMDYLKSRIRKNFDDDADEDATFEDTGDKESLEGNNIQNTNKRDSDADTDSGDDGEDNGLKVRSEEIKISRLDDQEEKACKTDNLTGSGIKNDIEEIFNEGSEQKQNENSAPKQEPTSDTHEEEDPRDIVRETCRLFVRNLPYTAGEEELRAVFEKFGDVLETHVVLDKATRRSKGYALIKFADSESALAAYSEMDGSIFMGRLLHILPGKRPPKGDFALYDGEDLDANQTEDGISEQGKGSGTGSSFKRQRETELKASANTNRSAWNALFMRPDTVAAAVAAHYGINKSDLLDPHAADMAVRLALGETQVIAETKSFLQDSGVNIESLEAAAEGSKSNGKKSNRSVGKDSILRSDRILLVKNLPYEVDEDELSELFGKFGLLARIVLPPTHTLALIEFVEGQDARKAFMSLAYKKFHSVPLYLEWAPRNIFSRAPSKTVQKKTSSDVTADVPKSKESVPQDNLDAAIDVSAELISRDADETIDSSTIYIKNLSFKTDEKGIIVHFKSAIESHGGMLRSARVAWRKAKDGRLLSSGFGFVECSSEQVARDTINSLQNSVLDGHKLVLQLSRGSKTGSAASTKEKNKLGNSKSQALTQLQPEGKDGTKIVVRNVAFEATRKDILSLFNPFGEISSCRLPKKFDGSHRGFAFIEFASRQEAKTAVESVVGTHLYGRRLVIEWAKNDGGIEELREKTASTYRGDRALNRLETNKRDIEQAGFLDDENIDGDSRKSSSNKTKHKKKKKVK